jgi:hypothetical protein
MGPAVRIPFAPPTRHCEPQVPFEPHHRNKPGPSRCAPTHALRQLIPVAQEGVAALKTYEAAAPLLRAHIALEMWCRQKRGRAKLLGGIGERFSNVGNSGEAHRFQNLRPILPTLFESSSFCNWPYNRALYPLSGRATEWTWRTSSICPSAWLLSPTTDFTCAPSRCF